MKMLSNVSFFKTLAVSALSITSLNAFADAAPVVVANSTSQPAGAPPWVNLVLIGGIIVFMWLFVFRPQSKRAKEQKEFLNSLSTGKEVVTTGGVIGTIVEVKENIVFLNVGNNTNFRVLKSAISGLLNNTQEKTK